MSCAESRAFYLGLPGAMLRLPSPQTASGPIDNPPGYAEETFTAWDGGTVLSRTRAVKRTWSLPYPWLTVQQADLLTSLYDGLYGPPPYRLVDPTGTNLLRFDTSAFTARHDWTVPTGTLDPFTVSPETAPASRAVTWKSPVADAIAQPGPTDTCDPLTAPVLAGEGAVAAQIAVRGDAGTAVSLQLAGFDTTGTLVSSDLAVTMPVGTDWRVALLAASQADLVTAGAAFVLPRVVATDDTPLYLAAAQVEYGGDPSPWRRGAGCPRVSIVSVGNATPIFAWRAHTLTLTER